ncbi:MAG: addiction module toxin, HicA family [Acidobacteriia bacterium]|nr:addiction module toxin, HicA family [Terriglobia bacterium]
MKIREILQVIEDDGWRFHSQKSSHRQFVHPVKKGRVTVPGKPGDDLTPGLLRSIFSQAQISINQSKNR